MTRDCATITMLKTLIIATVLLPRFTIAQQSQHYRNRDSQANGARWDGAPAATTAFPAPTKAPQAIPKNGFCPAGWRESGGYCIR